MPKKPEAKPTAKAVGTSLAQLDPPRDV